MHRIRRMTLVCALILFWGFAMLLLTLLALELLQARKAMEQAIQKAANSEPVLTP
jgi:hypothetical protein